MTRPIITLLLFVVVVGCFDDQTGLEDRPAELTSPSIHTDDQAPLTTDDYRPPSPHRFGPDSYRTGVFTGQGTTEPGIKCEQTTAGYRSCSGYLASAVDGTLLDISLLIPNGGGRLPLVVLVHGYAGSKGSSGDIARRLLDAGYAVLRYSTRGFGDSWGQVNLADVHAEIADLRSIVGQIVDVPGLRVNEDAVAITGASYGGGHSWLSLMEPTLTSPRGRTVRIRTVVPIVPWTDLLYSLIPNGRPRESIDRPGGAKLSFLNGLYASGVRDDPERPYPNYPDYLLAWHSWINAMEPSEADAVYESIEDGLAGYRSIWWQQRFWRQTASRRIPVFQIQGFTDDLFPLPEALRMLRALQTIDPTYPIASYFGDIGHPRASNKEGETNYLFDLLRTWLDYYLKGVGAAPPNVVYAAITRPREEAFDPANVITIPTYDKLATATVTAAFNQPAVLVNPVADPLSGFFWDPLVMEGARELEPLPPPPPSAVVPTSLAVYETPVAELSGGPDLLIAGQPTVTVRATTTAYRVQLNIRIFDVGPTGTKQLITRGTHTIDSGSPLEPLGDFSVNIESYGNLWRAPAGHRLVLEITNIDSPYISPSRVPSTTAIGDVVLLIPIRR